MRSPFFPHADNKTHPLRRRWVGSTRYWLFQAGGWGLFWLVVTLGSLTSGAPEGAIVHEIVAQTLLTLSLLICSHLLRVIVLFFRRFEIPAWRFVVNIMVAIVFCGAAASGPWVYWSTVMPAESLPDADLTFPYVVFLFGMSLLLTVWVGLYFGYHYYSRYQQSVVEKLQLDAAVKEAELRALRAQINPHFLFNSLNTLRALIPRNLDRPREAITLLADLLRASLTMGQQKTITLAQELETVRSYLALEQMRFEERLRVFYSISPDAATFVLPPFVLQTLVENALKFGVAPFENGGDVHITAENTERKLVLTVKNRGALNAASSSTGLGLKNARSRLSLLCGPEASLTLEQMLEPDGSWVVAKLVIPAKTNPHSSQHS
jgi:signal transduction histidine kinase